MHGRRRRAQRPDEGGWPDTFCAAVLIRGSRLNCSKSWNATHCQPPCRMRKSSYRQQYCCVKAVQYAASCNIHNDILEITSVMVSPVLKCRPVQKRRRYFSSIFNGTSATLIKELAAAWNCCYLKALALQTNALARLMRQKWPSVAMAMMAHPSGWRRCTVPDRRNKR